MSKAVLDASAVLAYAMKEPGSEVVQQRLTDAAMSAVNYSEVLKKTIERGGEAPLIGMLLERANVQIVSFDERHAFHAAALFPATKDKGLSFADRACLALALLSKATLYTADSRLAEIETPIPIVLIRESVRPAAKRK